MTRMLRLLSLAVASTVLSAALGCANWPGRPGAAGQVSESPEARRAAAIQAFEEQRDRAQLEAALDRWNQGDVAGCESRLRALVARLPQDADLHARLAELAWSCGDIAQAEAEYHAALSLAPDRADLEHGLGMLLRSSGREAEAAPHLARACQLDPANELFRL